MEPKDLTPEERAIALDRIVDEASRDNPKMCSLLAMKYEYGLDIQKNPSLALRWLHRAAELGDPWAQLSLGDAYESGRLENKISPALAFSWFVKAFNSGATGAAERLAMCSERGFGTETNQAESLQYWITSAQEGSPWAQIHVARMFQLGRGISVDLDRAKDYLRAAFDAFHDLENVITVASEQARKQYIPAMELLGFAYLKGWFGCPTNTEMANDWFRRADSHYSGQSGIS